MEDLSKFARLSWGSEPLEIQKFYSKAKKTDTNFGEPTFEGGNCSPKHSNAKPNTGRANQESDLHVFSQFSGGFGKDPQITSLEQESTSTVPFDSNLWPFLPEASEFPFLAQNSELPVENILTILDTDPKVAPSNQNVFDIVFPK